MDNPNENALDLEFNNAAEDFKKAQESCERARTKFVNLKTKINHFAQRGEVSKEYAKLATKHLKDLISLLEKVVGTN